MSVVTLASMIVVVARPKPLRMAILRVAPRKLLAHALVDEHVGVDRHADRECQASQAGECERGVEHDHESHDQKHVKQQRDVRHHAGEAIIDDHENDHGHRRHEHRIHAFADRVGSQRGSGQEAAGGFLAKRRGQAAGLEHRGQVFGFRFREIAADLPAIVNRFVDPRRRIEVSVEDDAEVAIEFLHGVGQVIRSQSAEEPGTGGIEDKVDLRPLGTVPGTRAGQILAGDVLRVDDHQDFSLPLVVFAADEVTALEVAAIALVLADRQPAGDDFLRAVAVFRDKRLARRIEPLGEFDEVRVIALVGGNSELEQAGLADFFLDPLELRLIRPGDDDLDLANAVGPDRDFLDAARIHAPRHGLDQIVVDLGVRPLALVVDFVDQDRTATEIDAQLGRPAEVCDGRRGKQGKENRCDPPCLVGHAHRPADVVPQHKRHDEHAQQHEQHRDAIGSHVSRIPSRLDLFAARTAIALGRRLVRDHPPDRGPGNPQFRIRRFVDADGDLVGVGADIGNHSKNAAGEQHVIVLFQSRQHRLPLGLLAALRPLNQEDVQQERRNDERPQADHVQKRGRPFLLRN